VAGRGVGVAAQAASGTVCTACSLLAAAVFGCRIARDFEMGAPAPTGDRPGPMFG